MPLNPTVWHFHRREDALKYVDFFDTGISNSMTLFAPRRKGKTALLLHDIRPLARDRGYNVIYCTFWDNKEKPAHALLTAIEHANEPVSITDRMKKLLTLPLSDLSLSVADIQIGVKLDVGKDSDQDVLQKLSQAFHQVAKNKHRTIFLLDEIQHLATSPDFGTLVAALRSAFDKYPDKLCALYTGSSRDGLHRLFREQKSPLFNAAQEYPLPDMGSDFVNFICERFHTASGRKIAINPANQVWRKVEKSPYHFMAIIERMLTNIEKSITKACSDYLDVMDNDPTMLKLISSLKPIDKILVQLIHEGKASLFGKETLDTIASYLGIDNVTRAEVQNAVRRLRSKSIIFKMDEGQYGVEMNELIPLLEDDMMSHGN